MICVSLREPDHRGFAAGLAGLELAEIRLDGAALSSDETKDLFARPLKLIATYRPTGKASPEVRRERLALAIRSGAGYVDLELDSPPGYREELLPIARERGCRIIISHHDERGTPGRPALERIVEQCFAAGADIAKIACRVNAPDDAASLLSLYGKFHPLIALGMGPLGAVTRIAAPFLGAPFTYASITSDRPTADGQLDYKTLRDILGKIGGS